MSIRSVSLVVADDTSDVTMVAKAIVLVAMFGIPDLQGTKSDVGGDLSGDIGSTQSGDVRSDLCSDDWGGVDVGDMGGGDDSGDCACCDCSSTSILRAVLRRVAARIPLSPHHEEGLRSHSSPLANLSLWCSSSISVSSDVVVASGNMFVSSLKQNTLTPQPVSKSYPKSYIKVTLNVRI
eukprot:gene3934-biopygen2007